MSSIFSRIISKEIPSYTVYEDEWVVAFLDISPIQKGHVLIVPKIEVDKFSEVPEPFYSQVFKVAQTIAPAIEKAVKCDRVGCLVEGFDVPHFHLHLVPLFKDKEGPRFDRLRKEYEFEEMLAVQKSIINYL